MDFTRVVEPLQTRLDEALKRNIRTKATAARIAIELSDDEKASCNAVRALLSHSAVLMYPLPKRHMCMLTDASNTGWGLIVIQVPD